jgi:hypothetical protein
LKCKAKYALFARIFPEVFAFYFSIPMPFSIKNAARAPDFSADGIFYSYKRIALSSRFI